MPESRSPHAAYLADDALLDREATLAMFSGLTPDGLFDVARLANTLREARHGRRATFVDNLHVNPSNICVRACKFCDFAALPGEAHAYSLSEDGIFRSVEEHQPTEVHIVGGLNYEWGYERSLGLVAELRRRFPGLHIKSFTAVEMHWFARIAKLELEDVLSAFVDAGMDGMPGGGAELFSEAVRQAHFKYKLGADEWLEVHERAHALGIPTNATMLYGFGEGLAERIEHLFRLREVQARSGGFVSFIPLAMQYGVDSTRAIAPLENLAMVAMSRLVLDNFPHIKAYWPMIGTQTAATALGWGADDLDGTLGLEKIAHAAGAATPKQLAAGEMRRLIETAGYEAVERDGAYRPIERARAA
ncbi:MAG: radical SAM protein [Gammaproteobacteria bacterium]